MLTEFSCLSAFQILARSSPEGLEGLLSVIESALLASSPSASSRLTATTTYCLASLLDSLSSSCHDFNLQRNILQTRKPLITALIECMLRHTPLLHDPRFVLQSCSSVEISLFWLKSEVETPLFSQRVFVICLVFNVLMDGTLENLSLNNAVKRHKVTGALDCSARQWNLMESKRATLTFVNW